MSAALSVPAAMQVWEETAPEMPPHDAINCLLNALDWLPSEGRQLFQAIMLENISLKTEYVNLRIRYQELEAENANLRIRNKELEAENQKLYEQLHLGSDTSSIPSSKDWNGNSAPKEAAEAAEAVESDTSQEENGRKETPTSVTGYINGKTGGKKRPGGQENHIGSFMHNDDADEWEAVPHYPEKCVGCPHLDQCIEEGRIRKRHTSHGFDIEIIRVHREHVLFDATECLNDGRPIQGDFPEVIGTNFYETNIQLHVITWHHIFHGSYDRIGLAAKELFGLSLSAGTANAIVQRVSAKILDSGFIDAVRFFILLFEAVLSVDETSACVNGRNAWVHTAVTANVTLLTAHWRRGYEGVVYAGVLQFYTMTIISDCWASYFNEKFGFQHAVCNGHILRELIAAAYFRKQCWAIEMFDLLLEILTAKRDAVIRGEKNLPNEYLEDVSIRYRRIVRAGFSEIAGETKGKTFSLLERLDNLEDAVLAFAVDFDVDFTNNASEQSLRNLKVALRVMGQFKTISGLADYCIIQSFMDTCRKQGHNPFDMLRTLLSGGDIIETVFGAEKTAQIKQMIKLADFFTSGDSCDIDVETAEVLLSLTDELCEAASYGRLKVYDVPPPPEKKTSSSAVPKDKMKAAREANLLSNQDNAATLLSNVPQHSSACQPNTYNQKNRAGPISAYLIIGCLIVAFL